MKSRILTIFLASLSLFMMTGFSFAKEGPPQTTIEGLERVDDSKLALVYIKPGADFTQYNQIFMVDTYVAFGKHWRNDLVPGTVRFRHR